jgi:ATP/maltotriose-dependent transcriptional regulator MalT
MPAASNLLHRAEALLPPGDPQRPRLLLEAGDALIEIGNFTLADELLRKAEEEATTGGDRILEITARLAHLRLRYTMDPEATEPIVEEEVARVVPELEALQANEGLARAWRLLTQVNFTACRWSAVEDAAARMTEYARLAGDTTLEARFLAAQAMAALYGPTPVAAAEERCRELLARAGDDRRTHAIILCVQAHLAAMDGRFDQAREAYRKSREVLDELGWRFHAALTSLDSGAVEMLAGDPVAAERELRMDYETLTEMGERDYMPTTAALLAEALYEQGRFDDAESFAQISETFAASEDITSQFLWRCVRAKVAAQRGERAAEALVLEALELTGKTEELESQAQVFMDLAEVLELSGRSDEAVPHLREALARYDAKGNVVSAARARERLDALADQVAP